MSEQVVVPISLINDDDITEDEVAREYLSVINRGYIKSKVVHLGKRGREAVFLKDEFEGRNIDWFINKFGGETWKEQLVDSRKEARERALAKFKKRSNVKGAREEMERIRSARVANKEYYGLDDDGIESLKETQDIILEAIKRPKINLESAAFVMMNGEDDA